MILIDDEDILSKVERKMRESITFSGIGCSVSSMTQQFDSAILLNLFAVSLISKPFF